MKVLGWLLVAMLVLALADWKVGEALLYALGAAVSFGGFVRYRSWRERRRW